MPAIFRSVPRRGVGFWRLRRYIPPGSSIRSGVFAMAGTATVPGVGASIASATFAIDGVASMSGAGVGIISGAVTSAGVASASYVGQPFFTSAFAIAGEAAAAFVKGLDQITSTNIIQKPVDYALAGEQEEDVNKRRTPTFRSGSATGRALRRIFRE